MLIRTLHGTYDIKTKSASQKSQNNVRVSLY